MQGNADSYLYQSQQLFETLHHDQQALEELCVYCLPSNNNLYSSSSNSKTVRENLNKSLQLQLSGD